jgi:glycosyltransferase involved in cell wall biosynthesis
MSEAPKVTVLMPTYNRPAYLPQAIASVVRQAFEHWELLVINDGGRDVRGVVEGFGDPRISYLEQAENRGKAACLNLGLERARGRYVAYLDDDDIWYPNHLGTLARALDEHPQLGVAYSDLYAVVFLKGPRGKRYPLEKRVVICRDFNRLLMFHFNHTLHVSLMHRKELALRAGGYDEDVRVLIDWNLTRKLCFYTDFLHVQATTGEYYQPVCDSDRISDVGRQDAEGYRRTLRRIRADLPPEPWPLVPKVAVVLPLSRRDEAELNALRYLCDRLDHPCRIVLVNLFPGRDEAACRRALGDLGELRNLSLVHGPPGADVEEAYLVGARSTEAESYYLASAGACPATELRLIKGLSYMSERGCTAVRWEGDREADGPDVLLSAERLFARGPDPTGAETVPIGWLPEELETDRLLRCARRCEADGDYRAARELLGQIREIQDGSTGGPYLVHFFARLAFKLGELDAAERMCRDLIARGYGADNWVRLGRIHQKRRRFAEALGAYRRGLEGIGLDEADLESGAFPFACHTDFDAFQAVAGAGECLVALGRHDEAARKLRRASRLRANSPRPHLAFGRIFLKHRQWDEAEAAFRLAAQQQRPARNVAVELGLAKAREGRGDLAGALEWCARGLERAPDHRGLMRRAARLGNALGRHEELAALYRAFLARRPGNVPALRGLAEVCSTLGREEEARSLAERADMLDGEAAA